MSDSDESESFTDLPQRKKSTPYPKQLLELADTNESEDNSVRKLFDDEASETSGVEEGLFDDNDESYSEVEFSGEDEVVHRASTGFPCSEDSNNYNVAAEASDSEFGWDFANIDVNVNVSY